MRSNKSAGSQVRGMTIKRAGRMVLDPLAEVRVRMLVSIRVGCRQLVMDVLGHSEGCKAKQGADEPQNEAGSEEGQERYSERSWYHRETNRPLEAAIATLIKLRQK